MFAVGFDLVHTHTCSRLPQPMHEVIEGDEDIKKVQAGVVVGLEQTAELMKEYLQLWEP